MWSETNGDYSFPFKSKRASNFQDRVLNIVYYKAVPSVKDSAHLLSLSYISLKVVKR